MPSVPSPCTDRCARDPRFGWCAGCLRTTEEIRAWRHLDDRTRLAVLEQCRRRARHVAQVRHG
ncbi:MAG: DUF1289 domain-containing protein [Candidatus Sericytochromatia bacterium]|nr:DUF1289 domain-containing protein [Candidatus Sericytochromatia bacterium]